MKKALRAISTLAVLLSMACGGAANTGLTVTIIPQQPYAIPYGTTTVLGTAVTAPYFVLNSVNLTWAGTNSLEVVAIIMSTPSNLPATNPDGTATTQITCGISGDQLAASYSAYNSNGNVVIPTATTANSGPMPCQGFTLPSPLPTSLSISVSVQVIGVIIDANGNPTGRVIQSQNITVQ